MLKYFLLIAIHLYWLMFPRPLRRKCIFKCSCSHYVYNIANEYGFIEGCKSLYKRYKLCRYDYQIILYKNKFGIQLNDGSFLTRDQISEYIISKYPTYFIDQS